MSVVDGGVAALRCESECPEKWRAYRIGHHLPAGLHTCDVPGRHIGHHCAGCGATWDEKMSVVRKSKREVPAVE